MKKQSRFKHPEAKKTDQPGTPETEKEIYMYSIRPCPTIAKLPRATDLLVLASSGPDVLQETVTLSKTVKGVVSLTHGANESAESVVDGLSGVTSVLVDLSDGDLDGSVVLSLDDAVGRRALAGDVAIAKVSRPKYR
jgi:hypothetical protein